VRIVVVGAGAIGTLFAARLAHGGHDVALLPRPSSGGTPGERELRVEGVGPLTARVRWAELHAAPDVVLAAVKSYDLVDALRPLSALGPIPLLLIQNGLGIEALADAARKSASTSVAAPPVAVRAVNSVPATWISEGVVRQAGNGSLLFDARPPAPMGPATETWAELLQGAGFDVRRVSLFDREVWRKLLVNAAINPVTADHGVENGRLALEPWRGQALALLEEARTVAGLEGVLFSREEAERELFQVVRATASNRSSMLQDLDRGRPTEIGVISGELLQRAERHGVELPATRRALRQILRKGPLRAGSAPAKP
jgi:2-dehydropantoate 2-reductase